MRNRSVAVRDININNHVIEISFEIYSIGRFVQNNIFLLLKITCKNT